MLTFLVVTGLVSLTGVGLHGVLVLLVALAVIGTGYVVTRTPQSMIRFVSPRWRFGGPRVTVKGFDNLPETGAAVALCDCQAGAEGGGAEWADANWAALQLVTPRQIRFFQLAGTSEGDNETAITRLLDLRNLDAAACEDIGKALRGGELICLISRSGFAADAPRLAEMFKQLAEIPGLVLLPVRMAHSGGEKTLTVNIGRPQPIAGFLRAAAL